MSNKSLEQTLPKSKGDAACKHILSHKDVLARILVGYVPEFRYCTFEEVANKYIEGDILVSESNVHRDEGVPLVRGTNGEDSTVNEGVVKYDIKFTALNPESEESIGLIINIEAQNKYNPGYSLVRRAIYYCSRLVSAQYGTEFTHSDYDKIKKVYSIWICTNPSQGARHTVTTFNISMDNVLGKLPCSKDEYDLMNVIMVCLGDPNCDYEDILFADCSPSQMKALQFLDVVFSLKLNKETKIEKLRDEFNFTVSDTLSEEVNVMCNVVEGWYEEGIEVGKEEGIEEGKAQSLFNLMRSLSITLDEAMGMLGIPLMEKEKYKKLISRIG